MAQSLWEWPTNTCFELRPIPWDRTHTQCYLGGTDLCLAQPTSDKLPPATDENKHRDPQTDNMQKVRDLGTLSPNREGSIKFFLTGTRKLCGRGGRKSIKARGDGRYRESRPSRHNRAGTHMNSQRLWQHAQGQQGVYTRWYPRAERSYRQLIVTRKWS